MLNRVEYADSILELCREIETMGYVCYIGHHRQQRPYKDQPHLVFDVNLVSILPKADSEDVRYALVELEGSWETLEEDRPLFTKSS